jgi:hypothetical protein
MGNHTSASIAWLTRSRGSHSTSGTANCGKRAYRRDRRSHIGCVKLDPASRRR